MGCLFSCRHTATLYKGESIVNKKIHVTADRLARTGISIPMSIKVAGMDIRVGDTVTPWKVIIDWSPTLRRFTEEVLRKDVRNLPIVINVIGQIIRAVFSPGVDLRAMMGAVTARSQQLSTPSTVVEAVIGTRIAPMPLTHYLEGSTIPPFVAAILFQIAMQALRVPCTIQRGWVKNIQHGQRLLFPKLPEGFLIYHCWNLAEVCGQWMAVDVTAEVKSVGNETRTMDEAGYAQDVATLVHVKGLPSAVKIDLSDLQMGLAVSEVRGMAVIHLPEGIEPTSLPPWIAAEIIAEEDRIGNGIELVENT